MLSMPFAWMPPTPDQPNALSVTVLDALTQPAMFAAVDVIPVAAGDLLHVAGLGAAGAAGIVACGRRR